LRQSNEKKKNNIQFLKNKNNEKQNIISNRNNKENINHVESDEEDD